MSFNWVPPTGLNNTSSFPSKDTGFRAHMQALLDQVKTFINTSLVNDNSLEPSGWRKLPDGTIEQWGHMTVSASENTYYNFPRAYTQLPFVFTTSVHCMDVSTNPRGYYLDVNPGWTNQFKIRWADVSQDITVRVIYWYSLGI